MKTKEIIEIVMKSSGKTKAELGRAVGIDDEEKPGRATDLIAKRIKQKNISINVLLQMLNAMEYTLLIVPKGTNLEDGEYEVTLCE